MVTAVTPLQLTAAAGLLQNQGLRPSPVMLNTVSTYTSTSLISSYLTMYTTAKAGTGGLANVTVQTLANIASPTCAALADGIPQYYLNLGTFNTLVGYPYPFPGLSGIIQTKANLYMGSPTGASNNWDVSRFCQIFTTMDSYAGTSNLFIESACNADNYLCDTFSNMDNTVTGDITTVNLATDAFGQDLKNLGNLIDLSDLGNLGSPLALVQRLISIVGAVPVITLVFIAEGVPADVVVNLDDPNISVSDSAQKAMYTAMTKITGDNLTQILQIFGVTTVGIETMADLLNPYKLFPSCFQSMTVVTVDGPLAIYTDSTGDVNARIVSLLPPYVMSTAAVGVPSTTQASAATA